MEKCTGYNISKIEFDVLDKKYEKTGLECEKSAFFLISLCNGSNFGRSPLAYGKSEK